MIQDRLPPKPALDVPGSDTGPGRVSGVTEELLAVFL